MTEFFYISVLISLGAFILSVFWLFDSIVSLALSLTIFSALLSILLLIIGVEFLSLSLAILYIGGMLVLFLFIVMSVGSEFYYNKEASGVAKWVITRHTRFIKHEVDDSLVTDNFKHICDANNNINGEIKVDFKLVPRHDILSISDSISSKQLSLVLLLKCFFFLNVTQNLIPAASLLFSTDVVEDDNIFYTLMVESEDIKAISLLLYTEFSFDLLIVSFILYSVLLGVVATVSDT